MIRVLKAKTAITASLIIFLFSGLVAVGYSSAAVSTPSVPNFSVQYVNHPCDRQPTITVNPYSGKTEVTDPGGHYERWVVQVVVDNQQFTSTQDASGNWTRLFYNISFKAHYDKNWRFYPSDPRDGYLNASSADTTIIELPSWEISDIADGGSLDVKVQALIGTEDVVYGFAGPWATYFHYFHGSSSDWSAIEILTVEPPTGYPTPPPEEISPVTIAVYGSFAEPNSDSYEYSQSIVFTN